jgi:hypothetical protein
MFETAFLQKIGSPKLRHEEELMHEELTRLGIPCIFYTTKQILRRTLPLTRGCLVVGDAPCIYGALKQLDVPIPEANPYPVVLTSYLHRRIWRSTLGAVIRQVEDDWSRPVFVKPASREKRFTGSVLSGVDNLYGVYGVSRRQAVFCSEPVQWVSEFRVYVANDSILAVDHYAGDENAPPELAAIQSAVAALAAAPEERRAGYAIDFGVLSTGETALVEMNDGFAIGAYRIAAQDYAAMVMARWKELMILPKVRSGA